MEFLVKYKYIAVAISGFLSIILIPFIIYQLMIFKEGFKGKSLTKKSYLYIVAKIILVGIVACISMYITYELGFTTSSLYQGWV